MNNIMKVKQLWTEYDQFQDVCCWERKKNPQNSISLLYGAVVA